MADSDTRDTLVDKHPEHDEPGEEHDEDSHEFQAGHARHTCTDPICLLVFLVAAGYLGYIIHYAQQNGDMRRLYHGFDFMGNLCGVGNMTDKPALYWCQRPGTPFNPQTQYDVQAPLLDVSGVPQLDLMHPMCIESCPTAAQIEAATSSGQSMSRQCYADRHVTMPNSPDPVTGTMQQLVTYRFRLVQDYPTTSLGGKYCLPDVPGMKQQVMDLLNSNPYTKWTLSAAEVLSCWWPLLMAFILAIICGYAYLYCLKIAAGCLVNTCMIILCIAPAGIGGYLTYVGATGQGMDGIPSTGDSTYDLIAGISCLVVSALFTFICCCLHSKLEVAIGCVEAACECMFDMPTLLLEPAFTLVSKTFWMIIMLSGFAWLLSCGQVQHTSLGDYVPAPTGGADIGGLTRSFTYTEEERYYILYYIFMIFWVLEICTALAQFCLAYAVQLWYFCPYDETLSHKQDIPFFPLCKGYRVGLMWHLGSLAFGAFLVAVLRLVRLILGYLAKQADKDGNAATACVLKVLMCCVDCFKRFVEFLNKNAYMDIAITSSHFCTAAKNAFFLIIKEFPAIAILNGACFVFQLAGMGAITAGGVYLVWIIITTLDTFTLESSEYFVQDPVTVAVVAGVICASVAYGFMVVFDMVADTMLYCFATEKKRRQKGGWYDEDQHFAPHTLAGLLQDS